MQPEAYERLWGVRRLKFFRVLNRRSQSGPGVSADLPNRFLRSVRAASVMSMFVLGYPRLVHTLIHWYKTSSSVSLKTTGWLWWSLCSGFFLSLNRVVALTFHLAAAFRDDNPAELSPIASFNLKQRAKNWFEEKKIIFLQFTFQFVVNTNPPCYSEWCHRHQWFQCCLERYPLA